MPPRDGRPGAATVLASTSAREDHDAHASACCTRARPRGSVRLARRRPGRPAHTVDVRAAGTGDRAARRHRTVGDHRHSPPETAQEADADGCCQDGRGQDAHAVPDGSGESPAAPSTAAATGHARTASSRADASNFAQRSRRGEHPGCRPTGSRCRGCRRQDVGECRAAGRVRDGDTRRYLVGRQRRHLAWIQELGGLGGGRHRCARSACASALRLSPLVSTAIASPRDPEPAQGSCRPAGPDGSYGRRPVAKRWRH